MYVVLVRLPRSLLLSLFIFRLWELLLLLRHTKHNKISG